MAAPRVAPTPNARPTAREPEPERPGHERAFVFEERDFRRVCRLIREHAGIQLSAHKRDMVYGRLVRRLRALSLEHFSDYLDLVEQEPEREVQAFVNALTTNLTSFFREEYHFTALADQLRAAHAARPAGASTPLLIWCAAASTGEEPYSLAITACEAFDSATPPVRILATDIDTQVLQTGMRGVYPVDRIAGLDMQRRRRFFQRGTGPHAGQCRVRPELQALIDFRPLNLLDEDYGMAGQRFAAIFFNLLDEDYGMAGQRFAAIFCRNVMIYFDKATQYQVLRRLVPQLAADGRLYAGHSESFHHAADLVTNCGRTIYRAVASRGTR
jgi:chemotaxis protein methyltransferase CheR